MATKRDREVARRGAAVPRHSRTIPNGKEGQTCFPVRNGNQGLTFFPIRSETFGQTFRLIVAWDPTEPVATRPLVLQRQGGWNFFYTHDGNKNVSDVVSFQKARGVPAHYEYAPFGAVTAATTNTAFTAFNVAETNPFRFSSEYADDALGLVYYNYRHYEPILGTWLSRDIIGEIGGAGLYCFLGNNIIYRTDILGLKPDNAVCDENHIGAVRATYETMTAVKGEDPEDFAKALKAVVAILLIYDIPIPGLADGTSIALTDFNIYVSGYPGGGDVAAEVLEKASVFKDVFSRNADFEIWSKVTCRKCKCINPIFSFVGLQSPEYSWEIVDESEWVKCDVAKTKWGKKAYRWRASPLNEDGSLAKYLLSRKDEEAIREQCGEQASKYCDDLGE